MGKKKANDNYQGFEDELTLAQLIQNAAARGLTSTRGAMFRDGQYKLILVENDGGGLVMEEGVVAAGGAIRKHPPKDATCACALGAMSLTPKLTRPLTIATMDGNDAVDGVRLERLSKKAETYYADERSMQIGLAYEQALRPEE